MQLADGFGSYLYIIFAVVYVIYSIIKAGKKVTQNRPKIEKHPPTAEASRQPYQPVRPPVERKAPEHNPGEDLKKMLEDLMGGNTEEVRPEVIKPKPQVVVPQKPKPVKITDHLTKKEKQAAYQTKKKEAYTPPVFIAHPEVVQKSFMELPPEEESQIDFDIRQAVIYSEIMKRPNW